MEELDKLVSDALNRYFTVLESTGYISDVDTDKLILLQFLYGFIQEYQYYITEADYNKIASILQCLAGSSCLVPYYEYKALSQPVTTYTLNVPLRATEEMKSRQSGGGDLRLVNQ